MGIVWTEPSQKTERMSCTPTLESRSASAIERSSGFVQTTACEVGAAMHMIVFDVPSLMSLMPTVSPGLGNNAPGPEKLRIGVLPSFVDEPKPAYSAGISPMSFRLC